MTPRGRRLPCVMAVALCVAAVAACGSEDGTVKGSPRASYSGAVALDGTPVSLGDMDGQVVLVNVWSVWCLPCRVESPVLGRLQRRYAAAGLRIIGVSIDPRGDEPTVRSFVQTAGIPYPVWLDFDGSVSARFPHDGVPVSYLIGPGGELLWARQGVIPEADPGLARALHRALVTRTDGPRRRTFGKPERPDAAGRGAEAVAHVHRPVDDRRPDQTPPR